MAVTGMIGLLGASTMTCVILISNWFYRQRGLAISMALVGTSLGSILLSPLNAGFALSLLGLVFAGLLLGTQMRSEVRESFR